MNKRIRVILLAAIALITVLLVTSCDDSPYGTYDNFGYGVSVKYDANGGTFTAGTSVIVDTYSLESLPTMNGKKVAKLMTPDDEGRGSGNSFIPSKTGYTFVGWYAECNRTESPSGETTYEYSKMWDFKNDRLELDPNKEYTASEPVLTLYAAWIPEFKFEFYSIDDPNTLLKEYKVAPYTEINVPAWDKKSSKGAIKMYQFPEIDGKTFEAVYADPEGTVKLSGETIMHSGQLNYDNATATDPVMKLYIETIDGEWYHIFTANQLRNISSNGNYVIENDIDLENVTRNWASYLTYGKFTGKLIGKEQENGEAVKLKNISFYQATIGADKYATGLFGQITSEAVIENIAFENVTMNMDTGAPMRKDVSFGLLAGIIDANATLNGVTVTGTVKVSTKCVFSPDTSSYRTDAGYSIGLICGMGATHGIDYSGILVEIVNDGDAQTIEYELDGNSLVLIVNKQ
ncbi:MAG: hypothetical protein IJ039_03725 [Clostridia bacterium]|nr:hypothetical protein [Clostridia bacterium]